MQWISTRTFLFCVFLSLVSASELGDPYKILGVPKKAGLTEIRKAYKQLAKAWHPDKSSDPAASEKFVEISKAYELLSDPERRRKFDDYGVTDGEPYMRQERASFHTNSPFDDLFMQHGSYFNFQENDITFFHKISITTRQYDKTIVPKSYHTPHLIFFYTDWCFPCLQTAPYCRKLVEYLEPLGINFVTVHQAREPTLARRLSIHALPCLVLLLDGHVYVYKDTLTSVQKIVDFIKAKLPYKMVPKLQSEEIDGFLNSWEDNKIHGLIFEPRINVRLRYLITAYYFRDRVQFGFVNDESVFNKYQVPTDMDSVLLFNENTSRPLATLSMKDIPTKTLHHVISANQYLALPRLSSQSVLDGVCPSEWNRPRKKLCVVLITEAGEAHDDHRHSFRDLAQNSPYSADRVRFAYIYRDKQTEFVHSLMPDNLKDALNVVILWRRDTTHVKFEWIDEIWDPEQNLNDTTTKLQSTISRLLKTNEALTHEASVKDLFDEHAQGLFSKIISKSIAFMDSVYSDLGKEHILPAVSVVGTIVFILLVGYIMSYLLRMEEESIAKQKQAKKAAASNRGDNNNEGATNQQNSVPEYVPELRLHELRSEKYNGMVRLLKPGCRTILLVLDGNSREQLVPPFHRAVWPYRKNKALLFGYMFVERGLDWYKEILELALNEEQDLRINPRNCVGTVLSLNGHRKYFCVFHAKHNEKPRKMHKVKVPKSKEIKDCESGAFIGFDSDSTESEAEPENSEDILFQGNLLDGFPNWLDRLFEGTTKRFHINYWPEFPNK